MSYRTGCQGNIAVLCPLFLDAFTIVEFTKAHPFDLETLVSVCTVFAAVPRGMAAEVTVSTFIRFNITMSVHHAYMLPVMLNVASRVVAELTSICLAGVNALHMIGQRVASNKGFPTYMTGNVTYSQMVLHVHLVAVFAVGGEVTDVAAKYRLVSSEQYAVHPVEVTCQPHKIPSSLQTMVGISCVSGGKSFIFNLPAPITCHKLYKK